jgi:Arc/MetJ-type ribon-helix-helix transcriptional regulator
MSYAFPADVAELVRSRMATGNYPSEDALIRSALLALQEQDEDLAAVQEALAELAAGDPGLPLEDAFDEIRQRYKAEQGA